jgi:putative aldouronate transport system permease protein
VSIKNTRSGRVFDVVNIVVLVSLAVVTLLPFIYVMAGSMAKESEITERAFFLWPHDVVADSYRYIFSTNTFVRSLLVTVGVTSVGMIVQVLLTFTMAYPLS